MLRASCDVLPTKQQCSCGADLLTMSEYRINKHFTGVQAQVAGHAGVKVQTLDVFYLEHIVWRVNSHTYCRFDSCKLL